MVGSSNHVSSEKQLTYQVVRYDLGLIGRPIRIPRDQTRHHSWLGWNAAVDEDHRKVQSMYPTCTAKVLRSWTEYLSRTRWLTSQAMDMILTGTPATASQMERLGAISRVVSPDQDVLNVAIHVAQEIAAFSTPVVGLAKQAIVAGESLLDPHLPEHSRLMQIAESTTLGTGLEIERALYYSSFSLSDCQEGVAAFLEKRPVRFRDC